MSHKRDPILGRYSSSADTLSFFAIVLSITYLGLQTKLPGKSHYQDVAKEQSSDKTETTYFSKYLAEPVDSKKKEAKQTVIPIENDDVSEQTGSIFDKFSFKSILADQDMKDERPQKTVPIWQESASENDEKPQKTVPICQKSASDCQTPTEKTTRISKKWNDNYSFFKSFFVDPSGQKEELSIFNQFSTKLKKSDLFSWLVGLLADSDAKVNDESSESKSKKTEALFSLSLPSFESVFADPDLASALSGKQQTEQIYAKKIQTAKESKKFPDADNVVQNDEVKQVKINKQDMPKEEVKQVKPKDETQMETDDLLEAFKIFLKGYSAGKNTQVSREEIKTEFKSFLETKENAAKEEVDYKVVFQNLKAEEKNSSKKVSTEREGTSISAILRSFLVDEEFTLGADSNVHETETNVPGAPEVDDGKGQSRIFEALTELLNEQKETRDAEPKTEILKALKGILADAQQAETFQKVEDNEKKGHSNTSTAKEQEESELLKLFTSFLADSDSMQNQNDPAKEVKVDPQSFFASLLVDMKNDDKPNNVGKALGGAKIISFFKSQINEENSSARKSGKGPVKEFLDVFQRFLVDENQVDALYEEVSNDDPFHLKMKSVLLSGHQTPKGSFSNEMKTFSSYLKKFFHSDDTKFHKKRNPCEERYNEDGNLIESFLGSILA